jgi:hypothetical protein
VINYDGRRFRPVSAAGADVADQVATYRQEGPLIWGEFRGGGVRRGALAGTCVPDGALDFAYCMVLDGAQIVSGRCHSTPESRADGGIDLREVWERYGPDSCSGVSRLTEIKTPIGDLPLEEA